MTSALIQGSQEWLNFRKKGIGASDAPVIMGVSPWKTPYELFLEKLDLSHAEYETPAMRRGKELESRARDIFTEITGIEMKPNVLTHQTRNWMIASLDGIDSTGKNIVEIKCPSKIEDHSFAEINKRVPEKYYPQLQHQIEVCGIDKAYYFSYFNDDETVLLEIGRNEQYIKSLIQKEEEFLYCVNNVISPKLTNKDYDTIEDPRWDQTAQELLKIKQYINSIDPYIAREKELKDILISIAQNRSCRGSGVKLQKCVRKGNVDYSKIEVLKGIDLDEYRKEPSEYWKLMEE